MCYNEFVLFVLITVLGLLGQGVWAEDERSFIGKDVLLPLSEKKAVFEHSFPEYLIDLTGDGRKERIHFVNRDGKDRIFVKNSWGKSLYQYDFRAVGLDATPYKILFRSLSPSSKVLVIYYYEGYTDYLKLMGSSRLYFLSFDKNDLKTLNMYRGPSVFYEHVAQGKSYRRREYKVELVDFNRDGKRDVLVRYNGILDIFLYRGQGSWLHQTKPPI